MGDQATKHKLNKKKTACKQKDKTLLREVQKELGTEIRKGKKEYRKKLEENFQTNNMKKVEGWGLLRKMSECKQEKTGNTSINSVDYATQLNHFYIHFECQNFRHEREEVFSTLNGEDRQELIVKKRC